MKHYEIKNNQMENILIEEISPMDADHTSISQNNTPDIQMEGEEPSGEQLNTTPT